jgi:Ser/Thr protein kinase RdoA (MazF antagonist)
VNGITSFDFGNCCRHHYAWDVAVSLSLLRRDPNRDELRDALLGGYAETFTPDPAALAEIKAFVRLRAVYVYLSRLWWFGPTPTAGQQETLDTMRTWVERGVEWPDAIVEPKVKRVVSP